jgi:hypothetical protein
VQSNVTLPPLGGRGLLNVTLNLGDPPAKRYERLKPWLDLANIALPLLENGETKYIGPAEGRWQRREIQAHEREERIERAILFLKEADPYKRLRKTEQLRSQALEATSAFLARTADTTDFPADALREWLAKSKQNRDGRKELLTLAVRSAEAFKFCTLKHTAPDQATLDEGRFSNYREDCMDQTAPEARVVFDRSQERLAIRSFDPYRDYFLPALEGVEIERIRRCPVCGQFFFAVRWDRNGKYGSKACSKKCNQVRRMRDWRASQSVYEQNRKFKLAGVRPEGKQR